MTGSIKKNILHIAIIAVLGLTVYSVMLAGPFKALDDQFSIVENPTIKSFANIGKIFRTGYFGDQSYYRPLVALTFMAQYHVFGLNPFFYNLANLIIHLAAGIVVYFFISRIFRNRTAGFFTALLFTVHPIHSTAVAYISGRTILLCGLFFFLSFQMYLLAGERKHSKRFSALSLLFFCLSLLCKESAVILPLILLGYEWLVGGGPQRPLRWRSIVLKIFPFLAIVLFYAGLRRSLGITEMFYWGSFKEQGLGMATFLWAFWDDLRIFLWPMDLHFDRGMKMFSSFWDPRLWIAIFLLMGVCYVITATRRRTPKPVLFFMFWFIAGLLPGAQIFPVGIQPGYISCGEQFLYIPSVGIFVLLVLAGIKFYQHPWREQWISKRTWGFLIGSLYLFFGVITLAQNTYAICDLALYQRTLKFNPDNVRVWSALGLAYANRGNFTQAKKCFEKALEIDPFDIRSRIGLGKSYCDQGYFSDCVNEYEKIPDGRNLKDLLKNNLRLSYDLLEQQYQVSLKKNPDNARAHYGLGVIFSRRGKVDEAMVEFKNSLRTEPNFKNALFNLASIYDARQDWPEALLFYQRSLETPEKDPMMDSHANYHLGLIYERRGDTVKAEQFFQSALKINPDFVPPLAGQNPQEGPPRKTSKRSF